ncbi:MAG: MFS transporter [Propioniciclava sp.]|uniref:MFS transporter n=1 Tax=Propioniciclava sp. TaxID=2038686 RepID=UPI0039E367BB
MITVLRNPVYARLFGAQIVALLGTGLLTIALGLLAFDIASGDAGVVLGLAMTIKMVAYVAVAPVTTALTARLPRTPVLIASDLLRAAVAVSLPFVTQAWQIYVLIFLLQSASATFTPTFQAVIPSVLPDEDDYTRALSLSRLAYDLESLVSPMIAAVLLTVLSYHDLFAGTVVGFLGSALLVGWSRLPGTPRRHGHGSSSPDARLLKDAQSARARFFERLTCGVRIFAARPELRGLIGLNLVVASATAMVIINTVVLVQGELGRPQPDVAVLLAGYGTGSMVVALGLPRLLESRSDRGVMLLCGAALPVLLGVAAGVIGWGDGAVIRWAGGTTQGSAGSTVSWWADGTAQWWMLLALWTLLGAATSGVLTPSARLLRRNSDETNRPAVFAAQFSLSHACYLFTYPIAGSLGAAAGLSATALTLAAVGTLGVVVTASTWHALATTHPRHKTSRR